MSDHGLKVGDVCNDGTRLIAGMRIRLHDSEDHGVAHQHAEMWLRSRSGAVWKSRDHGYGIHDEFIRTHGVTILALPEEAPKPAIGFEPNMGKLMVDSTGTFSIASAPVGSRVITQPAALSLEEQVPVGSRWRWPAGQSQVPFTITGHRGPRARYDFDGGGNKGCDWPIKAILRDATRIDEPAGAGKPTRLCNAQWGARYTCDLLAGHDGEHRDQLLERRAEKKPEMRQTTCDGKRLSTFDDGKTWVPTVPAPAMPPARCAPGCTPSRSCRIVIPVTDKGTRYECPAFAEERVKPGAMVLDYVDSQARDRYEARAMRDQRWEAMNQGQMVGRYVFNRR